MGAGTEAPGGLATPKLIVKPCPVGDGLGVALNVMTTGFPVTVWETRALLEAKTLSPK